MAEPTEAVVLERAKALAKQDGYEWDQLEFTSPQPRGTKIKGQAVPSDDRRQAYLARARSELRQKKGSGNP